MWGTLKLDWRRGGEEALASSNILRDGLEAGSSEARGRGDDGERSQEAGGGEEIMESSTSKKGDLEDVGKRKGTFDFSKFYVLQKLEDKVTPQGSTGVKRPIDEVDSDESEDSRLNTTGEDSRLESSSDDSRFDNWMEDSRLEVLSDDLKLSETESEESNSDNHDDGGEKGKISDNLITMVAHKVSN